MERPEPARADVLANAVQLQARRRLNRLRRHPELASTASFTGLANYKLDDLTDELGGHLG